MGLFRRLGRRAEAFRSEMEAAADRHSRYRCEACGARFVERHQQCPECLSGDVTPIEREA